MITFNVANTIAGAKYLGWRNINLKECMIKNENAKVILFFENNYKNKCTLESLKKY